MTKKPKKKTDKTTTEAIDVHLSRDEIELLEENEEESEDEEIKELLDELLSSLFLDKKD